MNPLSRLPIHTRTESAERLLSRLHALASHAIGLRADGDRSETDFVGWLYGSTEHTDPDATTRYLLGRLALAITRMLDHPASAGACREARSALAALREYQRLAGGAS